MAPRWLNSKQSAWGIPSDGVSSANPRVLVAVGLVLVIFGSVIGWAVRGAAHSDSLGTVSSKALSNSAVIDPTVQAVSSSDSSLNGSVKAATSLISGLPNLALKTPDEQATALADLLVTNPDAGLAAQLSAALTQISQEVNPQSGGPITAKLFIAPVSYKATMTSKDHATVIIWLTTVYLDSRGAQLQSAWTTETLQMEFAKKWRLAGYASADGPTPKVYATGGLTSTYNDVVPVVNGGFAYRYALAAGK